MRELMTLDDLFTGEPPLPSEVFDLEAAYIDAVAAIPADEHRYGHFHPSANDSCGRRNVYEYTRVPAMSQEAVYKLNRTRGKITTKAKLAVKAAGENPDLTPDVARDRDVMDFGHAAHRLILEERMGLIQAELESKGYTVEIAIEAPHDPETDILRLTYDLGGTADGVITIVDPQGNTQRGVLEVKSSKDKLFGGLKGAKLGHIGQAMIYALRFNCPFVWVWYFNKDNSDRRVFTYIFDPDLLDTVLARFVSWRRHADAGTLPERDMSHWMCSRCQYQIPCHPPILGASTNRAAVARARARGGLGGPSLTQLRRKP